MQLSVHMNERNGYIQLYFWSIVEMEECWLNLNWMIDLNGGDYWTFLFVFAYMSFMIQLPFFSINWT